jgi:uncharacterized UBP type Zn finger protein
MMKKKLQISQFLTYLILKLEQKHKSFAVTNITSLVCAIEPRVHWPTVNMLRYERRKVFVICT